MSEERKYTKKTVSRSKKPVSDSKPKSKIPTQNGPLDTSNIDNKVYTAPDGRKIIETDQTKNNVNIAE